MTRITLTFTLSYRFMVHFEPNTVIKIEDHLKWFMDGERFSPDEYKDYVALMRKVRRKRGKEGRTKKKKEKKGKNGERSHCERGSEDNYTFSSTLLLI